MTDPFDLEAQLLPEQLRRVLAHAAALIALDHLLRANIVGHLAAFKSFGSEVQPAAPLPSLEDPKLDAALAEHVEMGFLEVEDAAVVGAVHSHALDLCRRMPDLLLGVDGGVRLDLVAAGERVLRKVGVAWARVDMDSDPAFDGPDVDDSDISPAPWALMRELRGAAELV